VKDNGESKTGYYSSHGIKVPSGPSATSDGSQYLGRPRRYKYTGSSGQPSMSADSGFSSIDGIGRVNRGFEDDSCAEPMFPTQVDDEDFEDDDFFLRTGKLPLYSLGMRPRRRQEKLNPLKEGFLPGFVEDAAKSLGLSVPGVDLLLGKMILDREAEAGRVAIEEMCDLIGVDPEILSSSLIEPSDGPMIQIIQNICNLDPAIRLESRSRFREFLTALKDAIVTIVQAYDSVFALVAIPIPGDEPATLPAVNFISGLSGFFVRTLPIERLIFSLSSRLAQMLSGALEVSQNIESVSPKFGEAMSRLESGFGPVFSAVRQMPSLSLSRLGSLYTALDGDTSLCIVEELPISDEARAEIEEDEPDLEADNPDAEGGIEPAVPVMPGDEVSFPEAEGCACPISEARFQLLENRYNMIMRNLGMSESTLRTFIREMIREAKEEEVTEELPSRHGGPGYLPSDVLPYGQEYISSEEQEEREDISDEYIVSYKGDDGYSAYSARPVRTIPGSLEEQALRRIIREEAKKILDAKDDSKKLKKKDDDEVEEASGAAAGGGGPVTPLGTGPDAGIDHDHQARERSIYANERGFGGGKRSKAWMTYPVKNY
tara:strand:- start:697 stop:2499 length:1803 start_codon:yes stop_codon:yes gene_type:complete